MDHIVALAGRMAVAVAVLSVVTDAPLAMAAAADVRIERVERRGADGAWHALEGAGLDVVEVTLRGRRQAWVMGQPILSGDEVSVWAPPGHRVSVSFALDDGQRDRFVLVGSAGGQRVKLSLALPRGASKRAVMDVKNGTVQLDLDRQWMMVFGNVTLMNEGTRLGVQTHRSGAGFAGHVLVQDGRVQLQPAGADEAAALDIRGGHGALVSAGPDGAPIVRLLSPDDADYDAIVARHNALVFGDGRAAAAPAVVQAGVRLFGQVGVGAAGPLDTLASVDLDAGVFFGLASGALAPRLGAAVSFSGGGAAVDLAQGAPPGTDRPSLTAYTVGLMAGLALTHETGLLGRFDLGPAVRVVDSAGASETHVGGQAAASLGFGLGAGFEVSARVRTLLTSVSLTGADELSATFDVGFGLGWYGP